MKICLNNGFSVVNICDNSKVEMQRLRIILFNEPEDCIVCWMFQVTLVCQQWLKVVRIYV